MAVTLSADVLCRYRRVTLYNSPYTAHDRGSAVDLYPGDPTHPDPEEGPRIPAPSPVAGEVSAVRTVTAPGRPYAADEDHLIVVDTASRAGGPAPLARILHVDPAVDPGDSVAVGDHLGGLVRAGFFAPWVANHLHLEFRDPAADPYRASGSLPLALAPDLRLEAVPWDGAGRVVAAGDSYAVLDAPAHPAPGAALAGVAATDETGRVVGVLDGGLPHYEGGGLLGADTAGVDPMTVSLAGQRVGRARGRHVDWEASSVRANGDPVRGVALAVGREVLGVKLVGAGVDLPVGTEVTVTVECA